MKKKIDVEGASLILVSGNKILMLLRDDIPTISYPNHWCIAGSGHVDEGETPIEAAVRELEEETGYISKDPKHVAEVIYKLPNGKVVCAYRFWDKYDGKQKLECNEGQKIEFKSLEEIKLLKLQPGILKTIEQVLKLSHKE